ncbi:MAG: alkaline phosphatase family protein [Candidatus Krumholzibacteriia bacterium]
MMRWLAFLLLAACLVGEAGATKVLVLGYDGMDPRLVAEYRARGLMPNFDRVLASGGQLVPLGTAIPPQSPVAWSTFITGMDPGGHGIFDFIHRDPATLVPYLSTSAAMGPAAFWKLGAWRIPRGAGSVENLRHGVAFWQLLDTAQVDATVFKVPANFPPVASRSRTLSGMGTPDIQGTYGQYTYVTDDPLAPDDLSGGVLRAVYLTDGRCETAVEGPANVYRDGAPLARLPLVVTVAAAERAVLVELAGERLLLREGEWSPWLDLEFTLVPWLKSVRGVARVFLMETTPYLRLYVTPVQIDPAAPEMPISTPGDYSRELAAAVGPFYTQGLPSDTKALEEGVFTDTDYLSQSDNVFAERKRQLGHELQRFTARDDGFLFFYFNYPDQDCHMWWRGIDPHSPLHAACAAEHHERVPEIYQALDTILGGVLDQVGPQALVMVMSDHGFAPYYRSLHVNAWLRERGYLTLQDGVEPGEVSYPRASTGRAPVPTPSASTASTSTWPDAKPTASSRPAPRPRRSCRSWCASSRPRSIPPSARLRSSTPTARRISTTATTPQAAPTSCSAITVAGAAATSRPSARCRPRCSWTTSRSGAATTARPPTRCRASC